MSDDLDRHHWPFWYLDQSRAAQIRAGRCPHCGFWNHPDANMTEDEGAPIFCNGCHRNFKADE